MVLFEKMYSEELLRVLSIEYFHFGFQNQHSESWIAELDRNYYKSYIHVLDRASWDWVHEHQCFVGEENEWY
jgi:hypothetical protein